jgi:hypothetical protein
MNSLDCALKDINNTGMPIIFFRIIFSLMIPTFYFFAFIILVFVHSKIKKRKKVPYYILYTAFIYLVIYL